MADGYEPTSAVSQGAAAGAAMFGSPNADQSLGFSQLMQQRQLAQQGMAADERRASEEMSRFQQGLGFGREQMGFDREKMQLGMQESREQRSHEERMQQQKMQFEKQLQEDAFRRNRELQAVELEFAKSDAEARERLAPQLLALRKQSADANGKLAANKLLRDRSIESLGAISKQIDETRQMMKEARDKEISYGRKSATAAMSRIAEDLMNMSSESVKGLRTQFGEQGFDVADFEDEIGYNLLKRSGLASDLEGYYSKTFLGDFAPLVHPLSLRGMGFEAVSRGLGWDDAKGARNILDIDDDAISQQANILISKSIANSIVEQTGGKIASAPLQQFIQKMLASGDQEQDMTALMSGLQQVGVSPEVAKSALLHLADGISGVDAGSPFSLQMISQKRQTTERGSTRDLALEATEKLIKTIQGRSRSAAARIQSVDIDGLEAAQNYIRRATSGGGQFNRYELERMIPQFSGRADDDLLDSIRSSKSLQELEGLGEDPFGQLSRRMQESQSGADDLALKERELKDLYELGAGSKGIDAALRRLSGIR